MPAKDFYHDTVKTALIKDGWTVDDKSLTYLIGKRPLSEEVGALLFRRRPELKLVVFDPDLQEITQWKR
jgi:XisH protein